MPYHGGEVSEAVSLHAGACAGHQRKRGATQPNVHTNRSRGYKKQHATPTFHGKQEHMQGGARVTV